MQQFGKLITNVHYLTQSKMLETISDANNAQVPSSQNPETFVFLSFLSRLLHYFSMRLLQYRITAKLIT